MAKIVGKASVLQRSIGGVYTAIAQIVDISGPEAEVLTYDSTTLDTTGAGKTYAPTGFAEPGECSWNMFFDPALSGHQDLTDQITTPAVSDWKLIFSDNTEWPFSGVFTKLGPSITMDDGVKAACAIKLSGLVTYPT